MNLNLNDNKHSSSTALVLEMSLLVFFLSTLLKMGEHSEGMRENYFFPFPSVLFSPFISDVGKCLEKFPHNT